MSRDLGDSWFGDNATVIEREVWECAIDGISDDGWFSTQAIRCDAGREDHAHCDFDIDRVSDCDRELLALGALLWWVIEVVRKSDGHHEGRSAIRLRRADDAVPQGAGWVDAVRDLWAQPLPELDGAA